jgi:hypothetical protein
MFRARSKSLHTGLRYGGLAALALSLPLLTGAVDAGRSFQQRLLSAHNAERAAVGVGPLNWNTHLAASAQEWADHLAATGQFRHSPDDPRDPQGENLWEGTRGYYSIEDKVGAWSSEKRYFRPGTFPANSTTGRVEDVGHYTQLVWRDTQEVGCAEARNSGDEVLVCRYSSPGNYRGERPF